MDQKKKTWKVNTKFGGKYEQNETVNSFCEQYKHGTISKRHDMIYV